MCEACGTEWDSEDEMRFLRRYAGDQERNLARNPDDAVAAAEIARVRRMIETMENAPVCGGDR